MKATIETSVGGARENGSIEIALDKPARMQGISFFFAPESASKDAFVLKAARQPASGLFAAAVILVTLGFLIRLMTFGFEWLRENAKAAP